MPQPGEISLAHNGVLFLDELPEFKRTVLEVMPQPMEERRVTISRAKVALDFPFEFYADRVYESLPMRILQPSRKRMQLPSRSRSKIFE
jgi:hypothetical protein